MSLGMGAKCHTDTKLLRHTNKVSNVKALKQHKIVTCKVYCSDVNVRDSSSENELLRLFLCHPVCLYGWWGGAVLSALRSCVQFVSCE